MIPPNGEGNEKWLPENRIALLDHADRFVLTLRVVLDGGAR